MSLLTSDLIAEPILVGQDEVLLTDDYALVSSASQPGHFYRVGPEGTCACPSYLWRRHCRHLKAAVEARRIHEERQRQTWPDCGQVKPGVALWGRCAGCTLRSVAAHL